MKNSSSLATVDFETEKIDGCVAAFAPKPVGVSVKFWGRAPNYYAFGHPTENNSTKNEVKKILNDLWKNYRLIFHNANFDLSVARTHFDLPLVPQLGFDDTRILAFLNNPFSDVLSLKPLAEKLLGIPPEERDKLRDWIFANVPEAKSKRKTWKEWGAYISRAPGKLTANYANGDTKRTEALFRLLHPLVMDAGMQDAYLREQLLLPILDEASRTGVPVDVPKLRRDLVTWEASLGKCDDALRRKLKSKELNIDSSNDLADALEKANLISNWVYTAPSTQFPNGQRSTSKENLEIAIKNPEVVSLLRYRSALSKVVSTYGRPWLDQAERTGGTLHPEWNQVRGRNSKDNDSGTRTGRLSSNDPNGQNVPKRVPQVIYTTKTISTSGDVLYIPKKFEGVLCPLPFMRDYIVSFGADRLLIDRDYSQQEFRVLAHFEDGELLRRYQENPQLDIHDLVQELINGRFHLGLTRGPVKTVGFGILYGMGTPLLGARLGQSADDAKLLKNAYYQSIPGVRDLMNRLKERARNKEPYRTLGGRVYYCEPPQIIKGRVQTYEYKMLNYIIQGSSGDITKQSIINYADLTKGFDDRFLLTVHDELLSDVAKRDKVRAMRRMKEAMEIVSEQMRIDVDMLSDGKRGKRWSTMKKCA